VVFKLSKGEEKTVTHSPAGELELLFLLFQYLPAYGEGLGKNKLYGIWNDYNTALKSCQEAGVKLSTISLSITLR